MSGLPYTWTYHAALKGQRFTAGEAVFHADGTLTFIV